MVVSQGEVWWVDLPEPRGSAPGFRRPVVVLQGNNLNRSRIRTVLCAPLTSNLDAADSPGNVLLPTRSTRLPKDSVANVSQLLVVNRDELLERVGMISERQLFQIFVGLDIILDR
jgi:mRNA interferase MazF